jgi:phosphoribosylanthranilate isomerase
MDKVLIKVCGLRDAEMAQQAVLAGANFIGLVFHQDSKRNVEIPQAKIIAAAVKASGAIPVAVFVDQTAQKMQEICTAIDVQVVQLHGAAARREHNKLPAEYQRIYVRPVTLEGEICVDSDGGLAHCNSERDYLLFDNERPGSGQTFNWEKFNYTDKFRWFLSGGLTPDNVGLGIQKFAPSAVDVSSGVENKPGEKDIAKIKKFIAEV